MGSGSRASGAYNVGLDTDASVQQFLPLRTTAMGVSFIVAAYNIQKYVEACLASVLPCLRPQDELIVVNDGSVDGTPDIIQATLQGHPQVHVIHKANGGLSSARNAGLAQATREHVLFLDGDDVVIPEVVCDMLHLLDTQNPDILVTDHLEWLDDGRGPFQPSVPRSHPTHHLSTDVSRNLIDTFTDGSPCVWSRFFRRSLLNSLGAQPFPEWSMYDDMPTTPYLVAQAATLYYAPVAMVRYRMRPGSLTRVRSERSCTDMVKAALHAVRAGRQHDVVPALASAKWRYFTLKFAEAVQQGREVEQPTLGFYRTLTKTLQEADVLLQVSCRNVVTDSTSTASEKATRHAKLALMAPTPYAAIQTLIARHKRHRVQTKTSSHE